MTKEWPATSPWSQESSHSLTADDHFTANRAVAEAALPYTDAVSVCLDTKWLDQDLPDTEECETVYRAVEERFEPVTSDPWNRDSPQFRAAIPDVNETIRRLVSLDGIAGRPFVFGLAFRRSERWVYSTIPHHNWTGIDTAWVGGDRFLGSVADSLASLLACMVPEGTSIEWERDDRRYSVRGDSICVSTLDEMKTTCHGFTGVERVVVENDGRRVSLEYPDPDDERSFVERLVGGFLDRFVDVPDSFEFDDPTTGREFARIVRETLAAYRPVTDAN